MNLRLSYYEFPTREPYDEMVPLTAAGILRKVPTAIQTAAEAVLGAASKLSFQAIDKSIKLRYQEPARLLRVVLAGMQAKYCIDQDGMDAVYYLHFDHSNETGGKGWDPESLGVQIPVSLGDGLEPVFFIAIEADAEDARK